MITETLSAIQTELSAPKGQYNKFGGYAYRSCEDILEALKPLLKKYKACVTISDDIMMVGDRVYVKATATLTAEEESITATAFAREAEDKKGMDSAQVTGSTSSYARKYALNGLFAIDDNKDPDDPQGNPPTPPKTPQKPTKPQPAQESTPPPLAPPVAPTATTEPKELDYVIPVGEMKGYTIRQAYKAKRTDAVYAAYNDPNSSEAYKRAVEVVNEFVKSNRKKG
jgi:hypothetical protein